MSKRLAGVAGLALLAGLAFVAARGAQAATLDLSISVYGLPPVTWSGVSVSATIINAGNGLMIDPVGLIGSTTILVPTSNAPPITAVKLVVGLGGGTFTAFPGPAACPIVAPREVCVNQTGWGGALPITGVAKVLGFGGLTLLSAPLATPLAGPGVGGTAPGGTVQGTPWTTGTAFAAGGTTAMGAAAVLPLTIPVVVSVATAFSLNPTFTATLSIHLAPEPTPVGLTAFAALGLALRGRALRARPRDVSA